MQEARRRSRPPFRLGTRIQYIMYAIFGSLSNKHWWFSGKIGHCQVDYFDVV